MRFSDRHRVACTAGTSQHRHGSRRPNSPRGIASPISGFALRSPCSTSSAAGAGRRRQGPLRAQDSSFDANAPTSSTAGRDAANAGRSDLRLARLKRNTGKRAGGGPIRVGDEYADGDRQTNAGEQSAHRRSANPNQRGIVSSAPGARFPARASGSPTRVAAARPARGDRACYGNQCGSASRLNESCHAAAPSWSAA